MTPKVDAVAICPESARQLAEVAAEALAGTGRTWHAHDFLALTNATVVADLEMRQGFAVLRLAGQEAEILEICVVPPARRRGVGRALLGRAVAAVRSGGAKELFLEVAESNAGARALYGQAGFLPVGRRPGYYALPSGGREDALTLCLRLP